jgi:hypothetical protein
LTFGQDSLSIIMKVLLEAFWGPGLDVRSGWGDGIDTTPI